MPVPTHWNTQAFSSVLAISHAKKANMCFDLWGGKIISWVTLLGIKDFMKLSKQKQIKNRELWNATHFMHNSWSCYMRINYLTESSKGRQKIWWNFYVLIICSELMLIKKGLIYIHIWGTAYQEKEWGLAGNIKVFICGRKMWPTRDRRTESLLKLFTAFLPQNVNLVYIHIFPVLAGMKIKFNLVR